MLRLQASLFLTITTVSLWTIGSFAAAQQPDPPRTDRSLSEIRRYSASEARQAVAVDDEYFYAVSNSTIAKYSRESGKRIDQWKSDQLRPLRHLNAAMVRDGKLICSNSNYPKWPESSSVEIWDTKTMKHIDSHSLGIRSEGSLTWVEPTEDGWYAVFANYSKKVNDDPLAKSHRSTQLVKFDRKWRRVAGWTFPDSVLDRFDPHSCSGGVIGPDGAIYCTGHDLGEIYRLEFPLAGSTLRLTETLTAPITGQGIAVHDGTLWGINRPKGEVIVCQFPIESNSKSGKKSSPSAKDNSAPAKDRVDQSPRQNQRSQSRQ